MEGRSEFPPEFEILRSRIMGLAVPVSDVNAETPTVSGDESLRATLLDS